MLNKEIQVLLKTYFQITSQLLLATQYIGWNRRILISFSILLIGRILITILDLKKYIGCKKFIEEQKKFFILNRKIIKNREKKKVVSFSSKFNK